MGYGTINIGYQQNPKKFDPAGSASAVQSNLDSHINDTEKHATAVQKVVTLTHSKEGTVHTLTGLPGTAGLYTAQFKAAANYAEGDTFAGGWTAKPTGEEAALPDNAFVTGDIVSVQVDAEAKRLNFKLGGGSKVPKDLPPLLPNFRLEYSGTTVTVTATKLPKNDNTAMLAGGVWVLDSKLPESPKGAIVKQWTAAELIDATQAEESKETVTWTYTNWTKGEPVYCRQYTYNPKGQYNTTVMGGVASTLDKPPFELPVFTGNHAIFGDETAGRIELYESGTLTLSPGTYDFFLVGGGGAGKTGHDDDGVRYGGGGGGSGYTTTIFEKRFENSVNLDIIVGAGGTGSNYGSTGGSETKVSLFNGSVIAQAAGGVIVPGTGSTASAARWGGNGGSGGGSGFYVGGSGGSDGANGGNGLVAAGNNKNNIPGGTGQGKTTRMFEELDATLYAGGGAGSGEGSNQINGSPGAGGGGAFRAAATPNTGGGGGGDDYHSFGSSSPGAGGSGIVIVRWKTN